jgi:hypothetical protein
MHRFEVSADLHKSTRQPMQPLGCTYMQLLPVHFECVTHTSSDQVVIAVRMQEVRVGRLVCLLAVPLGCSRRYWKLSRCAQHWRRYSMSTHIHSQSVVSSGGLRECIRCDA